jgi:hypothetical protein
MAQYFDFDRKSRAEVTDIYHLTRQLIMALGTDTVPDATRGGLAHLQTAIEGELERRGMRVKAPPQRTLFDALAAGDDGSDSDGIPF